MQKTVPRAQPYQLTFFATAPASPKESNTAFSLCENACPSQLVIPFLVTVWTESDAEFCCSSSRALKPYGPLLARLL